MAHKWRALVCREMIANAALGCALLVFSIVTLAFVILLCLALGRIHD